jgi:hypothetical protein
MINIEESNDESHCSGSDDEQEDRMNLEWKDMAQPQADSIKFILEHHKSASQQTFTRSRYLLTNSNY